MEATFCFQQKTEKYYKKVLTRWSKYVARPLNINTFQGGTDMTDSFLNDLKQLLEDCIAELDQIHSLFCKNPLSDFTRDRKISFQDYCRFMIQMQSKSLPNEVMDYFGHSIDSPTKSALVQQKYKFLAEGWDYLFHIFIQGCHDLHDNTWRGHRVLACDGSDANIAHNPADENTFIHEGQSGYNAIHINALYDLTNHTYCDFLVQGKKKLHERKALNDMIDRYCDPTPAIVLADRGYESFNTFAHLIRKGMKFVIRMKDIDSNGILSAYDLPDGEFDEDIKTTLTRRHTKQTKENPDTYTILSPYTDFDFLDTDCKYYDIEFRIVRFLADDGKYVCVATNLPREEFPLGEIKKLYRMRWSEETSFRELKYTIGLINWHSKKYDGIIQELYARMILYNFCEMAVCHAVVTTKDTAKHIYKINFATAVNICRAYLKDGGDETEMMLLIQRHLTPVRAGRKYPIHLRPKRNRDFMYRAA